jgi:DNA-binding MurR/RpiR family transcriptional regulator
MSVLERFKTSADQLTPAERRLVQEVIAKPRDAALGTAAELARIVGVHEATASRLARKLGFGSYATFRDAIRDEFIVKTDPAVRVRNTLETAGSGDLLTGLIAEEVAALTALPRYVPLAEVEAVAALLATRRKVFVFARGNAEALAVMAERRLRRYAFDVQRLSGDGRDLAEQTLAFGPDDAVLAFAFRRQPRHFAPLIERARAVGAASITISDQLGPTLSPAPDYLLSAPRSGRADHFQTLTVPMAITNALVLAMAKADTSAALDRLETLGGLISDFEG